jgi:hypothetical protein
MLEHDALVLRPWSAFGRSTPPPTPFWALLEPSSLDLVGLVRREPCRGSFFNRLLSRPHTAIHESDDEPLVCTIQRSWHFQISWEVRDAEGQPVGQFTSGVLRGSQNRRWRVHRRAEGCAFGGDDGPALAEWIARDSDRVLTFSLASREDPLARMLALAAAAILNP